MRHLQAFTRPFVRPRGQRGRRQFYRAMAAGGALMILSGCSSIPNPLDIFKGDSSSAPGHAAKYETGLQGKFAEDPSVPVVDRPGRIDSATRAQQIYGNQQPTQAAANAQNAGAPTTVTPGAPAPTGGGGVPTLSDVPDNPVRAAPQVSQQQAAPGGLASDRANARYTDEPRRAPAATAAAGTAIASPPATARQAAPPPATNAIAPAAPTPPSQSQLRPAAVAPPPSAVPPVQAAAPQLTRPAVPQTATTAAPQLRQPAPAAPPAQVQQAPARTAFAAPPPQTTQNPFRQPAVAAPPPSANSGAILASPGRLVAIIMFRSGSSNLSAKDRAAVKQVADYVTSYGGALRVVGHASSRTREVSVAKHKLINFNVSLGRAESVARELMRQGVPGQAIVVEARGDSEPRYIEAMPSGEAQNRRAEIYLIN